MSPVTSTTRARSARSSARKSCSRLSPSSAVRVSEIDVPVVRQHLQPLIDLQPLDGPPIHPAGAGLARQHILAAQVRLHGDDGPLFHGRQRSRRDGPPGRDHGRRVARGHGRLVGVRHLLCLFGGDHVPGRQLFEHAVLHPLVAGVPLLVGQPAPHEVQAGKDAERFEEPVLAGARVGAGAAEPPVGQIDQVRPQRLRFVGLLREDVGQPFVGEIHHGEAVATRVVGRRLAGDVSGFDNRDRGWSTAAGGAGAAGGFACDACPLTARRPATARALPRAPRLRVTRVLLGAGSPESLSSTGRSLGPWSARFKPEPRPTCPREASAGSLRPSSAGATKGGGHKRHIKKFWAVFPP